MQLAQDTKQQFMPMGAGGVPRAYSRYGARCAAGYVPPPEVNTRTMELVTSTVPVICQIEQSPAGFI